MERIGIIELNSTEIKLMIADMIEEQSFVVIEKQETKLKIATDLVNDELISQQNIFNAISILKTYKAIIDAYKVNDCIAVVTSEFLTAKNQRSFFDEVYSTTNFKFKFLTEDEETLDLYLGFINSLDCPKGLILNINGITSQIMGYNRRNTLTEVNLQVGSVSFAKKYFDGKNSTESAMKAVYDEYSELIKDQNWFSELDTETQVAGTGDIFVGVARLSKKLKKYPYSKDHSYQFNTDDLNQVYDFVKGLEIDSSKKLKGVSLQSADVLACGIAMLKAFADKCQITRFVVSTYGVAEGICFSKSNPVTLEKPISDVLGASLETINSYYNHAGLQNTKNVYELSLVLFKQLKVLHKLPRNFVKVLRVASYFHDAGRRVSSINYEKKGFDVVLNSDILGIGHHEQVLAAFVVASQNLQEFNMTDWVRFNNMVDEADLEGVRKLAIIVKLSSRLDAFGSGKIKDISCDILGDSVIMKTIVESPADMEILEGLKISNDFTKAFKKHLEIL